MVDLPIAFVQLDHRPEHRAVLLAVEVLRAEVLFNDERVEVTLVEEHRSEDRLLGLEVVRGDRDVLDGAHDPAPESRCGAGGVRRRLSQPA